MSTVDAHATTPPGEPLAPTMVERADPCPRDAADSVVRLLTRPGAMP